MVDVTVYGNSGVKVAVLMVTVGILGVQSLNNNITKINNKNFCVLIIPPQVTNSVYNPNSNADTNPSTFIGTGQRAW